MRVGGITRASAKVKAKLIRLSIFHQRLEKAAESSMSPRRLFYEMDCYEWILPYARRPIIDCERLSCVGIGAGGGGFVGQVGFNFRV